VTSAPLIEAVARLAAPWQSAYADSRVLPTLVVFVHLAALLIGGGLALAADRGTLRSSRATPDDRARQLAAIGLTHRPVVAALGVSFVSGALLFLADVEAFATSRAFWAKMAVVALLLANGFAMTRTEQTLRATPTTADQADGLWRRLRASARASAALWLLTLFLGAVLANG
jgi:hypothetical protein